MRKVIQCFLCQKDTRNPKYCSRKCAGLNSKQDGLRKSWICRTCRLPKTKPSKYATCCEECFKVSNETRTIGVTLVCPQCQTNFTTKNTRKIYCSEECYAKAKFKRAYAKHGYQVKNLGEGSCSNCNDAFIIGKRGQKFCSEECSTVALIISKDDIRIGEIRARYKNKKYGHLNIHTLIRGRARMKILILGLNFCMMCGYNKAIHACHIKDVVSFSDDNTVGEANSVENLLALCPNHHTELDKLKCITVEEIKETEHYKKADELLKAASKGKQKLITSRGAMVSAGVLNL